MSLFQMQSDVDERLPVVPHLNGSVLAGGAHQETVPAEIAGGGDGLESTETRLAFDDRLRIPTVPVSQPQS